MVARIRKIAPRNRRFRGRHARSVESRSLAMEKKLAEQLDKIGKKIMNRVIGEIRTTGTVLQVSKAMDEDDRALFRIFRHFGLMQLRDGGREVFGDFTVRSDFETRYFADLTIQIQQLRSGIEQQFREGVSRAMAAWSTEATPPTTREVARRLRKQYFVEPDKWTEADEGALKPLSTATSRFGLARRAMPIARTEVSRARNTGRVESMREAGFTRMQWSSYNDSASRAGHAAMNGDIVEIGEKFYNKNTKTYLSFPGDPTAPPSETINCRCTVVPVL